MSKCPKCGKENQDDIKFCPECGQAINGLQPPSPPIPVQPIKTSKKKSGCFGCLGLIVILFVIGSCFGSQSNNSSNDPNTPATTTAQPSQSQAKPAEQQKVKTYKAGHYKVGNDLPAGEYVAISKGDAYIELTKDSTGSLSSILANDVFVNRSIITVSDGQYLKLQNCELYSFNDAPKAQIKDGFLLSGMYKVGTDFPAGEYKVNSTGGSSYVEISASSSHSLGDIISNDIFQGDKYITVSDGQYVKFFQAKIKVK